MKNFKKIALASAVVFGACNFAAAESSIIYRSGSAPKFDKKIQAAAIKRAVEKIGELRGSLEGVERGFIITEKDLRSKRSAMGFPRLRETPVAKLSEKPVPIV